MDIFGYYTFNPHSSINISEFIAHNFVEFAERLVPDKRPKVLFADLSIIDPNCHYAILYHPEEVTLSVYESTETKSYSNVLIIDEVRLGQEYECFIEDQYRMFMILWQDIFHEIRHFIQFHIFKENQTCFFTEEIIQKFMEVDCPIAQSILEKIHEFKTIQKVEVLVLAEIDAVILSMIATSYFTIFYEIYSENMEEEELLTLLKLSMQDVRNNSPVLFKKMYTQ